MRKQREMRIFPIHHWNPLKRRFIMSFFESDLIMLVSMISLPNFWGNFRNFSPFEQPLIQVSHGKSNGLPRDQSSGCQNPDNTARRGGKSNDSEGHKSWVRWGLGVLAKNFLETFGTLVLLCFFFSRFVFCSRIFCFFLLGRRKQFLGGMFT